MSSFAEPAVRILRRIAAYRRLLLLTGAVFLADQASKGWVERRLPFGTYGKEDGAIPVIRNFFYIVHVGNTGAAWSLFAGRSSAFAVLAVATLLAIFLGRYTLELKTARSQTCFGLLCGGIVGNLVDRLAYGHVVDFIDLHFGSYTYPTFNVADSGICVGVGLYLLLSLIPRSPSAPGSVRARS